MAALYKHGPEVARWRNREMNAMYSARKDGKVLVNYGRGWKLALKGITLQRIELGAAMYPDRWEQVAAPEDGRE